MTDILTITANPSIDMSTSVPRVMPTHKLRCVVPRRDAGGGGINVARVVRRLGADVMAMYPIGGVMGQLLRKLVDQEGIPSLTVTIAGETREDMTVLEEATGQQYRFILPGPHFSEDEWRGCLDVLARLDRRARLVVASGSLPPGMPDDFYARIARGAKAAGARIIVDTSGAPLKAALEAGVYLIKPSLREFRELMGGGLNTEQEWIAASRSLVDTGRTEIVALSLGEQGALLVSRDLTLRAKALPITPVSVVGAGDSFLGGMIWSLAAGQPLETAFRYGIAAASATLLASGTELARPEDVERLVHDVEVRAL